MKALGWGLAMIAAPAIRGWAVSVLWGWFVVPLGVVAITWAHGYGLALVADCVVSPKRSDSEDADVALWWKSFTAKVAVWLSFGWLMQAAMGWLA